MGTAVSPHCGLMLPEGGAARGHLPLSCTEIELLFPLALIVRTLDNRGAEALPALMCTMTAKLVISASSFFIQKQAPIQLIGFAHP